MGSEMWHRQRSTGTSGEIKEQYEKMKSLVGDFLFSLPSSNIEKIVYGIK